MLRFAAASVLAFGHSASPASAGVPDPARVTDVGCGIDEVSRFVLAPGPSPCQYRFRSDGGLDALHVKVTPRDCFFLPRAGFAVKGTLVPATGASVVRSCEPDPVGWTDSSGAAELVFRAIGGQGTARVVLTLGLASPIPHAPASLVFDFTSPDQDGNGDAHAPVSVIDLGMWAAGLGAYRRASDFDCNGTVNILDLGVWAGGLGKSCP